MTEQYPVSVIVPCYCNAGTLDRAINSIMNQTRLPAELIMVDDASSDGGATRDAMERIRQEVQTRLPTHLLYQTINRGPSAARNRAWEIAGQPYVAFLDADDAWHPQKLEIQFSWMRAHPEVSACGHRRLVFQDGYLEQRMEIGAVRRITRLHMLLSCPFPTYSVIVRRDLPFRFPEHRRYCEDHYLWSRILMDGRLVTRIELPLGCTFKAFIGQSGLSADWIGIEQADLGNIWAYRSLHLISFGEWLGLSFWSILKFAVRGVRACLRSWLLVRLGSES